MFDLMPDTVVLDPRIGAVTSQRVWEWAELFDARPATLIEKLQTLGYGSLSIFSILELTEIEMEVLYDHVSHDRVTEGSPP